MWGDNQNVLPEINRVFVLCGNDTIPYLEKAVDRSSMVFVSEQPFKGEAGKTYKLVVETPTGDITAEDYLTPLGDTDYFQIHPGPHKSEELSDAIGHDGA